MPRIFQATCEIDITCVSMRFVMSYVGDCGFNIEGEHSDGCKCCGFMSETYQDSENTIPIYRNHFGASAGMDRFLENSPKEKSTSWADNIDAVCPDWLRDELKRLFPETVRPPPVYSDPDSLNSSSSRDSRLPTMTFTNSETRPSCSDSLPLSLEKGIAGIQLDVDYSQVQVPPWLKKGNNKPVQFQRAANMVQEDFPPINQANIKYSISPNGLLMKENNAIGLQNILKEQNYRPSTFTTSDTALQNRVAHEFNDMREYYVQGYQQYQNKSKQTHQTHPYSSNLQSQNENDIRYIDTVPKRNFQYKTPINNQEEVKNNEIYWTSVPQNTYAAVVHNGASNKKGYSLSSNISEPERILVTDNGSQTLNGNVSLGTTRPSEPKHALMTANGSDTLNGNVSLGTTRPNEVNSLTPITLSISKELNMDPLTCKSIYEWDKTLRGNGSMASMSDNPKPAPQQTGCTFCEKNGETDVMVKSHNLYNPLTKLVECPILRAYRCEICQATGDLAHTRSYCPRLRMVQGKVRSATVALKSTKRQANGSLRNVNKVSKVRL